MNFFNTTELKVLTPCLVMGLLISGYMHLIWGPKMLQHHLNQENIVQERIVQTLSHQIANLPKTKEAIQPILSNALKDNKADWISLTYENKDKNITFGAQERVEALSPATLSIKPPLLNNTTLYLTYDFYQQKQEIEQRIKNLWLFIIATLLIITLALWAIIHVFVLYPVRNLIKTTDELFEQEYNSLSSRKNKSDVGKLTDGFIAMRNQLETAKENHEQNIKQLSSLAKQNMLMAKIIRESSLAIAVFDIEDGTPQFSFANKSFENLCGYNSKEMGRKDSMKMIQEIFYDQSEHINKHITEGRIFNKEIPITTREKYAIWCNADAFPVYDNNGEYKAYTIILEDINDRKNIDQMKNGFISNVSHGLRTPLTSIHGSLALLNTSMRHELSNKVQPIVDVAYKNSNVLTQLVDDILDTEQINTQSLVLKPEKTDIIELLKQSVDVMKNEADERNITFKMRHNMPPFIVKVDHKRIRQVFENILSNAIKFSSTGGYVEISAYHHNKNMVRVKIHDFGVGIASAYKEKIFQKFFQVNNSNVNKTNGTGLGLYISKILAEKHNGQISFESYPEKGTSFYIDIPLLTKTKQKGEPTS